MPSSGSREPDFSDGQAKSLAYEELAQWPWQDAIEHFLSPARRETALDPIRDYFVKRSFRFTQNSQGVIHVDNEPSSSREDQPPSRDLQYDQIFFQDSSLETFSFNND
jgi:hypothetical protein